MIIPHNRPKVHISRRLQFASNIPNAESHYAVGDIAAWSGIKRCGAAMAMGFNAATNIHQQLLETIVGKKPDFVKFPDVPPMIGLAVGKKAVSYSPSQGVESGEKVMEMFFGDDLGFTSKFSASKPGESISNRPLQFAGITSSCHSELISTDVQAKSRRFSRHTNIDILRVLIIRLPLLPSI